VVTCVVFEDPEPHDTVASAEHFADFLLFCTALFRHISEIISAICYISPAKLADFMVSPSGIQRESCAVVTIMKFKHRAAKQALIHVHHPTPYIVKFHLQEQTTPMMEHATL
jgi:hypothetical protein